MTPTWLPELRRKFPALRSWTYLDTAAAGPITFDTARAGASSYENMLANGDADWEQDLALIERARLRLSTLAHAPVDDVGFVRNTSHGASLAAQQLWEAGRRTAVAFADEFPSSTLPFLNRGFDVKFVPSENGRYSLDAVADALKGRDVLIASHVMYRTGFANDLTALGRVARYAGAELVVCTTQGLGVLPVDVRASGASYVVGSCHKWVCAGYGAAYCIVREDLRTSRRWPQVGWLSSKEIPAMRNDVLELDSSARVLDAGVGPIPSLLALDAALGTWLSLDRQEVASYVRFLTRTLREKLAAEGLPFGGEVESELSGITVIPVPEPAAVVAALKQERILTTPRGVGVRVSLHAFNDVSDVGRLVEALTVPR